MARRPPHLVLAEGVASVFQAYASFSSMRPPRLPRHTPVAAKAQAAASLPGMRPPHENQQKLGAGQDLTVVAQRSMSAGGCREEVVAVAAVEDTEEDEHEILTGVGSYGGKVRMVKGDPADEMMLLWGIQQPTFSKANAFVYQSSLHFRLDACGRSLSIFQSPSSLSTPGVTGAVMWDSGVVLGKFLEHAMESGTINLQGKKVIELGSGCGLVGCIAALLGAQVFLTDMQDRLTDMQDRLRLLKKNVEANLYGDVRGSATVSELTWGDDPDSEMIEPLPDYVLGSDVIYSEGAVIDLLDTLLELSGSQTTVILAGELRNDAVLEYFLEAVMQEFVVARVDQAGWHPEHRSPRVVMYVMVRKIK